MVINKMWIIIYRITVIGMILFGSVVELKTVWSIADFFMGLMVLTNLISITLLGKYVYASLKDYKKQSIEGKNPTFHASTIPNLKNTECWENDDLKREQQII